LFKNGVPSGNLLQFAIEHGPFTVDLPIKDGDFPWQTVGYQRVPPRKKNLVMFPVCLLQGDDSLEARQQCCGSCREVVSGNPTPQNPKNIRGVQWGNPQGKCLAGKIHDVMMMSWRFK
jgi:hypothetical protein